MYSPQNTNTTPQRPSSPLKIYFVPIILICIIQNQVVLLFKILTLFFSNMFSELMYFVILVDRIPTQRNCSVVQILVEIKLVMSICGSIIQFQTISIWINRAKLFRLENFGSILTFGLLGFIRQKNYKFYFNMHNLLDNNIFITKNKSYFSQSGHLTVY